jgi:hypothetical protein
VAAHIHARVHPHAQCMLRIHIVHQLGSIHETIGAFKMIGLQFSRERRKNPGAIVIARQTSRRRQIVKGEGNQGMRIEP